MYNNPFPSLGLKPNINDQLALLEQKTSRRHKRGGKTNTPQQTTPNMPQPSLPMQDMKMMDYQMPGNPNPNWWETNPLMQQVRRDFQGIGNDFQAMGGGLMDAIKKGAKYFGGGI